jgi:arginine decarboxylase
MTSTWSIESGAALYGVQDWGASYFEINDAGELCVKVKFDQLFQLVPIVSMIEGMKGRGHDMPVLLRIENILDQRIKDINEAFAEAIRAFDYKGCYRGVFPIKVNQQCHVIEEITKFGKQYHHGLEAGSKAELIVAMSHLQDSDACLICNGYKDTEFVRLGLHALELGMKCFFVVETPSEVAIIIEQSRLLGVRPKIGIRVKLSTKVEGHWNNDSGDRSLFGLTTMQIVSVVDQLRSADMLDCLELLHVHIGSQIPNIRNIRESLREACRFYVELKNEGAPLGFIDLGGGLAVDYTGASTNETHSKNYNLSEYCIDIVEALTEHFNENNISHPTIITESGRATVAYSSMLLFNILDVSHFRGVDLPETLPEEYSETAVSMWQAFQSLDKKNVQETYNDAIYYREETRRAFLQQQIGLRELSFVDNIYLETLERCRKLAKQMARIPPDLAKLDEAVADIYYGNFSLFQSLPDAWAIEQIFPVMPVHRLGEMPTNPSVIADLTCDADGKIDLFAKPEGDTKTILLHDLKENEEYYLGVFLVGAYQETLGDLHNLFGDTHVVSVRINESGSFEYIEEIEGDSIGDVISYVEYNPKGVYENLRQRAEASVHKNEISVEARRRMLSTFKTSLDGYTYFEREE